MAVQRVLDAITESDETGSWVSVDG